MNQIGDEESVADQTVVLEGGIAAEPDQRPLLRRLSRNTWIAIAAAGALVLGSGVAAVALLTGPAPEPGPAVAPPPVEPSEITATPEPEAAVIGDAERVAEIEFEIAPQERPNAILAREHQLAMEFEVGQPVETFVKVGQRVRAGDVLAREGGAQPEIAVTAPFTQVQAVMDGDRGSLVKTLHDVLIARGAMSEPEFVSGSDEPLYGPVTKTAVRTLMEDQGLTVGRVDEIKVILVPLAKPEMEVLYAYTGKLKNPGLLFAPDPWFAPYYVLGAGHWYADLLIWPGTVNTPKNFGDTVTISTATGNKVTGVLERLVEPQDEDTGALRVRLSGDPGWDWFSYLTGDISVDQTQYARVPVSAVRVSAGPDVCVDVVRAEQRLPVCAYVAYFSGDRGSEDLWLDPVAFQRGDQLIIPIGDSAGE